MVIPANALPLQFTFWENVNFGEVASASSQSTPLVVAEAKHFWNKSSSFFPLSNAAVHWEKNSCAAEGGGRRESKWQRALVWRMGCKAAFLLLLGDLWLCMPNPASLGHHLSILGILCGWDVVGFSVDVKGQVGTPVLRSGVAWSLPHASHGIFKVWRKTVRWQLLGGAPFSTVAFSLLPPLPKPARCSLPFWLAGCGNTRSWDIAMCPRGQRRHLAGQAGDCRRD